MCRDAVATNDDSEFETGAASTEFDDKSHHLTLAFVRLCNQPTYPLDRLSRYEATLWRQACQILFALQCLDRRKWWERRSSVDARSACRKRSSSSPTMPR
jgi:hypothetical protein